MPIIPDFSVFKRFLSFPVELPLMNIPIINLLVVKKCETSESIQFSQAVFMLLLLSQTKGPFFYQQWQWSKLLHFKKLQLSNVSHLYLENDQNLLSSICFLCIVAIRSSCLLLESTVNSSPKRTPPLTQTQIFWSIWVHLMSSEFSIDFSHFPRNNQQSEHLKINIFKCSCCECHFTNNRWFMWPVSLFDTIQTCAVEYYLNSEDILYYHSHTSDGAVTVSDSSRLPRLDHLLILDWFWNCVCVNTAVYHTLLSTERLGDGKKTDKTFPVSFILWVPMCF